MTPSNRSAANQKGESRRRGVVLLIVLIVVMVLALAAYSFSDLMTSHRRAALMHGKRVQARMLADSGVDAIKLYLSMDDASRIEAGGHFNNPYFFQGAAVIPEVDLKSRGSFTVLAPYTDEDTAAAGVRYGLEDESTRLNLNVVLLADKAQEGAAREVLMNIPGMTEDVADAILDWLDEDDEPREFGAEADYYTTLNPPYAPKNGPLDTVEELLLVRGVTPNLLFGVDTNRNGMADAHEMTPTMGGMNAATVANTTTTTADMQAFPDRGWAAFFTLYSSELNVTTDGLPRIDLNGEDLNTLKDELSAVFSDEWVSYILAYRLYGAYDGDEDSSGSAGIELDLSASPKGSFSQVLDLIGSRVQIAADRGCQGPNQPQPILDSPFQDDLAQMGTYVQTLMDNCTITRNPTIPGRVNINEAPREILLGIPGMNEDIVNECMSRRSLLSQDDNASLRNHETWLLTEGIVTLDEMRTLMPFICAGGDVYRAQIVGYFQGGGPSARIEAVFDATGQEPRVLFWRDISHLGRGHSLETLGIDYVDEAQVQ